MESKKLEKPCENATFQALQGVMKPDEETGGVFPTENYFVHGFDANRPDNEIEFMGTFLDEDNIPLLVKDNGYGMTEEEVVVLNQKIEEPIRHSRENFGLKNLNQRLKLFYGPSYGLHIEKNESGGSTVFIKIRKMTVEEYEENRKQLREPEGNPGSR